MLFRELKEQIRGKGIRIVFPEGISVRVLGAVSRLHSEGILVPIIIGNKIKVSKIAEENGINISNIELIDPLEYNTTDMVYAFAERRKGRITNRQAELSLQNDVNYFGTMLVYMGIADGMVSGAIHYTANTIRPALQLIKTKPDISLVSGAFLMTGKEGERFIFADCAININPTAEQLAEIARETAITAKMFHITPKIAMLSFSTMGSSNSQEAEKIVNATKIAKERFPELDLDGEIQFDAAISQQVGKSKAPYSPIAGKANVFIFPNLDAGNIGYKIAQRLGNLEAVGPILQGLNKPVCDLSRGCSEEDIYKTGIITALQALLTESKETSFV